MLLSTYDYNILSFFFGVAPYNVTFNSFSQSWTRDVAWVEHEIRHLIKRRFSVSFVNWTGKSWTHDDSLRASSPGTDQGFFVGGVALFSCSTSTPINHIVFFFWQNASCIRKPQFILAGGGVRTPCTLPLDPPLLSVVIARRAAHRLPMNDHLALFLDGGVVIFTRRYF